MRANRKSNNIETVNETSNEIITEDRIVDLSNIAEVEVETTNTDTADSSTMIQFTAVSETNEMVEQLKDALDELEDIQATKQTKPNSAAMNLQELLAVHKTKSGVIRHMHYELGMPVKDIAKQTGILYQHVRNVVLTPLKRS